MDESYGRIEPYLGKSEKGVYYGFEQDGCRLQIWFLSESVDHTEWTPKHEVDLRPMLASFPWKDGDGSWYVQGDSHEAPEEEEPEWDSDDEDGIVVAAATEVSAPEGSHGYVSILGFHPFKEIIFLHTSSTRVMAYHLNSSKLEDLGCLPLDDGDEIRLSCAYTPCWMESCLTTNSFQANTQL